MSQVIYIVTRSGRIPWPQFFPLILHGCDKKHLPFISLLPIAFRVLSPFGPQAEQGEGPSSAVLLTQDPRRAGPGPHDCLRASS